VGEGRDLNELNQVAVLLSRGGSCNRAPDSCGFAVPDCFCDRRSQRRQYRASVENELYSRLTSRADNNRIDDDQITVEVE